MALVRQLTGGGDIVLIQAVGAIVHDRIKTGLGAFEQQLGLGAVIQMTDNGNIIFGVQHPAQLCKG